MKLVACITIILFSVLAVSGFVLFNTDTAECVVHENGCLVTVDGKQIGQFQLHVETGGFIQPFRIYASGEHLEAVNLEISGVTYYMGYNHYSVRKQGNAFVYSGVLPGCIYRFMQWKAVVELVLRGNTYRVDYIFAIEKEAV